MSATSDVARFSQWRARVAAARVLIVGDVMLDRYWFGDVERISPEAPVPVVKIARSEERPGGAANVARNVAALGAQATLLSATGNDEPADALARLLDVDRIRTSFLRDAGLTTTVKLRVIGRQQQLLRIDFETAPPNELLASSLAEFDTLFASAHALVLSDYGKGGLAHIATMIGRARAAGKPVLVDPKGDDWDRYRGATVITPNRSEFRQVAGRSRDEADLERRAQALRQQLDLRVLRNLVAVLGDGLPVRAIEPAHPRGDEPLGLRAGGGKAAFDEELISAQRRQPFTAQALRGRAGQYL